MKKKVWRFLQFFGLCVLIMSLRFLGSYLIEHKPWDKEFNRRQELIEKYGEESVELAIYGTGTDPEQCQIVKTSKDGEYLEYEVTTDQYGLDKELTFHVWLASSTNAFGWGYTTYLDNDFNECLFEVLFPPEVRPDVFTSIGKMNDFWIDPLSFDEDISATADALDLIESTYEKYGFDIDRIPYMSVKGTYVKSKRQNGNTITSEYLENVPKDLVYQTLFENRNIYTVNEDSYGGNFRKESSQESMRKRYICWAIEKGLVDIYSQCPYEERQQLNGFEISHKQFFAVVDGEPTDEAEEIFTDYEGNLLISSFYTLLKNKGWDVEGNWYHYKVRGIDGKEYEYGYDLCGLFPSIKGSEDANDDNYSRTGIVFYYVCDGVKYLSPDTLFDDYVRNCEYHGAGGSPIISQDEVKMITGYNVTSNYEGN